MGTDKIIELARSVATLSGDEVGFFERTVRSIQVERALAAREDERIAKLRAMDDESVVYEFLQIAQPDASEVLAILRDAGFVRQEPKAKVEFIFIGGRSVEVFGPKEALDQLRDQLLKSDPGLRYSKAL